MELIVSFPIQSFIDEEIGVSECELPLRLC